METNGNVKLHPINNTPTLFSCNNTSIIKLLHKIIIKINDKCKTPLELTNCIKEQLVQYLKKISCN